MKRRIGRMSLLLACTSLAGIQAQLNTPPVPDQPSNGMLELHVKQGFDPEPPPRRSDPPKEPLWKGVIDITLKNISRGAVHIEEVAGNYDISVLDAAGKPVPLTEYGEKALAPRLEPSDFPGPISVFDLKPGQEFTHQRHLSVLYRIEPGQAYTVKVRRSRAFPMVAPDGWPVLAPRRELRVTLEIPAQASPR